MRKLILISLIAALAFHVSADPFFSLDKADHFMTALVMTAAARVAVECIAGDEMSEAEKNAAASAIPIFLSIAKEVYDGASKKGTVSYKDLIYDFSGIITGLIIAR